VKPTIFSAAGGGIALLLGVTAWLAPAAQASQRPGRSGPASARPLATLYPYNWSRIAWTGSDTVIAGTDSHGDLYYFWQASGSATWHRQLVAKGGGGFTYKHPSIAWEGSAVVIAALDASADLVYFGQPSGSSTWNYELVATAASFGGQFEAPAITAGDGEVLISTANKSGELVTYSQTYNGPNWTEQTVAFGTFGASSIATVYDSLDSSYLGLLTASSGGTLYFWYEYLAEPGWNQQTVAASSSQGSFTGGSIMASANNLLITAASTAGSVYAWTQPIGSSGWTKSKVASATSSTTYASPQTTWTGFLSGTSVSYDVITATTQAGTLDYWWQADGDAGPWNPETIAKKSTTAVYANPGITVSSTSVAVTAINTKPGDVMYWYQGLGTNPWFKQVVAKG
jgi:hypothetical protein